MVKRNSTPRLSYKVMGVILTQTDTTVGFLSQDETRLQEIKSRTTNKPFIKVYRDFKSFKKDKNRVPNSRKSIVRRSKKTTFIVKDTAFRVVQRHLDSTLLNTEWYYSTSANETSKNFDRIFCEEKTDIIIENKELLREGEPSSLFKINSNKIRKLR
jgi:tRNA A37 threonylcarbamoyladenosine synthetase subunit TsaC/SUA5/YrdC